MAESSHFYLYRRFQELIDYLNVLSPSTLSPSALSAGIAGAAIVASAIYFLSKSPRPLRINYDPDAISKEITGEELESKSESKPRISLFCDPGDALHHVAFGECKTLHDCFKRGLRVSNDGPCLGWRPEPGAPYKWLSYSEVEAASVKFGSGLLALGAKQRRGSGEPHHEDGQELVGIYSQNTKEWLMAAQGAWAYSMCVVPLYDTLGPQACTYIINQALIVIVLCDTIEKVKEILKRSDETPSLRHVVLTCPASVSQLAALKAEAGTLRVLLHSFAEVVALGEADPRPLQTPQPEDVAIVCYTSGTTGDPKGAMLTHKNYTATVAALARHMQLLEIKPGDIIFSYLPLAHTFEQVATNIMFAYGCSIGIFQGDMKLLMDDMAMLKPTIFPTVPRLLNRMYDNVLAKARASSIKSKLFDLALRKKMEEVDRGIVRKDSIWDRLVFKKVHATMGGRVRAIFCGSAPLEPNVLRFVRCATGAVVLEGYGQTECAAVCACQLPGETISGQVGPPLPSCMLKLADVPEMEIAAKDGKGEICIKGPNVFQGYLKDPVKTAEALDADGWLHTGDIGIWGSNGGLKVVDRKKHIFKLAQGEYIAPEKIEGVFGQSAFVAQVFLHGESYKSCLVAFVVPNQPEIENWANKNGIDGKTFEELVEDPRVKKAVLEDVNKLGRAAGLKSFELIKDLKLCVDPWTVEAGLLTPTFKTKRPQMKEKFETDIKAMYEKLW